MTFRNDYRISSADSARISCDGPDCHQPATTSINNGSAPFMYFCDEHAAMMRRHGRCFVLATPNPTPHAHAETLTSL